MTTFRDYRGPGDILRQYEFWLRATDGLPYAWRSNLTNARNVSQHTEQFPGSRIYAEREGDLVGYIGTHPPFEWEPGLWVIPFGYPWTYPHDPDLARELYDRMVAATPKVYADQTSISCYVQRFRGSWQRHIDFFTERGWYERWRHTLLARRTTNDSSACGTLVKPAETGDLQAISDIALEDPSSVDRPTVQDLENRLAGGWLEWESLWLVPGLGAFEVEVRRPWGEVRFFAALPDADNGAALWDTLLATAHRGSASEIYFTVEEREAKRRVQLELRGYRPVDAGVYLTLDV